ncbi:hypothetical protein AC18_5602 [Escherichia coli 2-222-05_S3_C2]|nr:hypothetical protein AC18_5602 [Escherichia coli 2-222-05_S3_C2]KEN93272.1 hypothetical protein AB88_5792 [Escherichia coli 2-222-05_S3_C1]
MVRKRTGEHYHEAILHFLKLGYYDALIHEKEYTQLQRIMDCLVIMGYSYIIFYARQSS